MSRRERATRASTAPPAEEASSGKLSEWAAAAWKSAAASGIERTKAVEQVAAFERDNAAYFEVLAECEVAADYSGPTPNVPPSLEDMEELYAAFRDGERLHQKFMLEMLLSIKLQWTCQKPGFKGQVSQTLIDLPDPPEGSRMVIVGDTHGQLQDVLWIFEEYGFPSASNIYLFNGDVRRAAHANPIGTARGASIAAAASPQRWRRATAAASQPRCRVYLRERAPDPSVPCHRAPDPSVPCHGRRWRTVGRRRPRSSRSSLASCSWSPRPSTSHAAITRTKA